MTRKPASRALALAALLCAAAASLSCTADRGLSPSGPAGREGELVVHLLDLGERSEKVFALRLPGDQTRALSLATPTTLPGGTRVRVQGADDGRTIQVTSLEPVIGDDVLQTHALVSGTKKRDRSWAFVLVDTGGGVNITKAEAESILFGQDRLSIRGYYQEVSYGLQTVRGQVFGPMQVPVQGSQCDVNNLATQLIQKVSPQITEKFDQYLWYIGRPIANCPWNGAAEQGRAARPTQHSFYNASTRCSTLAQEPGHNFGMVHSSALLCRDGTSLVSLPTSMNSQCQHIEYGNPFDPMGRGCGHMNGVQKAYQEWLEGCNVVKVTRSGTFTLFPLEQPCNGVQLLQVPTPVRQFRYGAAQSGVISSFYLELRAPVGFDATAIGRGDLGDGQPVPLGVYVVMGGDIRDLTQTGNPNWLLDMTPGSKGQMVNTNDLTDGALPVGKPFKDPTAGGPTITVVSVDATKAVVRVELSGAAATDAAGEGTCLDNMPFQAPGPTSCAAAPVAGPSLTDAGAGGAPPVDSGPSPPSGPPGQDAGSDPGGPPPSSTGGQSGSNSGAGGARGGAPGSVAPPPATPSSGCTFAADGDDRGGSPGAFATIALLFLIVRSRRRSRR